MPKYSQLVSYDQTLRDIQEESGYLLDNEDGDFNFDLDAQDPIRIDPSEIMGSRNVPESLGLIMQKMSNARSRKQLSEIKKQTQRGLKKNRVRSTPKPSKSARSRKRHEKLVQNFDQQSLVNLVKEANKIIATSQDLEEFDDLNDVILSALRKYEISKQKDANAENDPENKTKSRASLHNPRTRLIERIRFQSALHQPEFRKNMTPLLNEHISVSFSKNINLSSALSGGINPYTGKQHDKKAKGTRIKELSHQNKEISDAFQNMESRAEKSSHRFLKNNPKNSHLSTSSSSSSSVKTKPFPTRENNPKSTKSKSRRKAKKFR